MTHYRKKDDGWSETCSLAEAFGLTPRIKVISFIGSGGKSSLIRLLAREQVAAGKAVAITTTTHIRPIDNWIEDKKRALEALTEGSVVTIAEPAEQGKIKRLDESTLEAIFEKADLTLIEADGAKMMPLKYPAAYEPVLHPKTDLIILVAGMSALGRPLREVCHRVALSGLLPDLKVEEALIFNLLQDGYFEPLKRQSRIFNLALNQVDDEEKLAAAEALATSVMDHYKADVGAVSAHRLDETERL